MKKIIFSIGIIAGISLMIFTATYAAQVFNIGQGGTATSTIQANNVFFGSSGGVFMTQNGNLSFATTTNTLTTQNLTVNGTCTGCGSGGGAAADWIKQNNYGVLNLTASTTIPYWAKDAIYASSTLTVQGLTNLAGVVSSASSTFFSLNSSISTTTEATSTFLSVSNISKLGIITTGTWNGNTIGVGYGGTGLTNYTTGDLIYANTANSLTQVSASIGGYVLSVVNGIPGWVATSTLSTISGTLSVNKGGTGLTTYTKNQLLYASDTGTIGQIATSSLGLLTTDVAEGNNLYWTNNRFDNRLSATTTQPNLTILSNLATVGTITSGTWQSKIYNNGTTTINSSQNIGINTTQASSSLRYYDGTAARTISDLIAKTFTIASTTLLSGTTTIPLGTSLRGETWISGVCYTDQGTAGISFGTANNLMLPYIAVTTSTTTTIFTSLNTFGLYGKRQMQIGTLASSPNYITCSVYIRENAD